MNFECLLLSAKAGNEDAITAILQMYRPLLLKYAIIDGVLDEDLYQELSIILLKAVPSRFMRKIVCRLRLNEVSRQ